VFYDVTASSLSLSTSCAPPRPLHQPRPAPSINDRLSQQKNPPRGSRSILTGAAPAVSPPPERRWSRSRRYVSRCRFARVMPAERHHHHHLHPLLILLLLLWCSVWTGVLCRDADPRRAEEEDNAAASITTHPGPRGPEAGSTPQPGRRHTKPPVCLIPRGPEHGCGE